MVLGGGGSPSPKAEIIVQLGFVAALGAWLWWAPQHGFAQLNDIPKPHPRGQQTNPLAREGRCLAQASTTFCSIAPKIEWPSASFISTRTVSPGAMKRVLASPSAMVSIMRISAIQL